MDRPIFILDQKSQPKTEIFRSIISDRIIGLGQLLPALIFYILFSNEKKLISCNNMEYNMMIDEEDELPIFIHHVL